MAQQKYKIVLLFLVLTIFAISLSGNVRVGTAFWDQDTLEPDSARVVNIPDCPTGIILDITYEVLSGPSIDAYLREGFTLLLFGRPADYILFNDDSTAHQWSYTVPSTNDYSVIFLNDKDQDIVIRYFINLRTDNPFGVFPFEYLLLITVPIIVTVIIVIVVIILVIRWRSKKSKEGGEA